MLLSCKKNDLKGKLTYEFVSNLPSSFSIDEIRYTNSYGETSTLSNITGNVWKMSLDYDGMDRDVTSSVNGLASFEVRIQSINQNQVFTGVLRIYKDGSLVNEKSVVNGNVSQWVESLDYSWTK
jgi:hypothetical protein